MSNNITVLTKSGEPTGTGCMMAVFTAIVFLALVMALLI